MKMESGRVKTATRRVAPSLTRAVSCSARRQCDAADSWKNTLAMEEGTTREGRVVCLYVAATQQQIASWRDGGRDARGWRDGRRSDDARTLRESYDVVVTHTSFQKKKMEIDNTGFFPSSCTHTSQLTLRAHIRPHTPAIHATPYSAVESTVPTLASHTAHTLLQPARMTKLFTALVASAAAGVAIAQPTVQVNSLPTTYTTALLEPTGVQVATQGSTTVTSAAQIKSLSVCLDHTTVYWQVCSALHILPMWLLILECVCPPRCCLLMLADVAGAGVFAGTELNLTPLSNTPPPHPTHLFNTGSILTPWCAPRRRLWPPPIWRACGRTIS